MVSKNQEFVYLDFQLSTIHFLAGQRLAEFSNAFFQNFMQHRTATATNATSVVLITPPAIIEWFKI